MKLVKSLLLGSAAGIVAVSGASAADLGIKKPTAVEYVKTCPTYGAGFFVVPGTTACLKIVGRVRVDYISGNTGTRHMNQTTGLGGTFTRGSDLNVLRARGYVGYDHRQATEYGLLRTYVRAFFGKDNAGADGLTLEYAFIQFGGLTVGRVTPNFEHGWSQFFQMGAYGGLPDITYVNAIGYTASFGGGFSATLAIEGANEHRTGIAGGVYSGQAMPDLVGSLGYDASWGSIKATGALHQVRTGAGGGIGERDSRIGFAVGLAAKIKLDMLTKGSNFWLGGYYADGAIQYAGFNPGAYAVGSFNVAASSVDATVTPTGLRLTKAYGVSGALQVFVMPTVSISVGGNYGRHNAAGTVNDYAIYGIRGQVAWTPVPGFLIGTEVGYNSVSGRATVGLRDKDDFVGRIRFQRDF
jgi:hypothetical protein